MTATVAPSVHWETRLFSDPTRSTVGRGWDAPVYGGVDDLLGDARSRLSRVSARAAYQEVLHGRGVLVDIRPAAQRAAEGDPYLWLPSPPTYRNVPERGG